MDFGGHLFHQGRYRQIVGNHRVGAGFGHGAHRVGQTGQFRSEHQGVQGHMDPHPTGMTKAHGVTKLLRREIAGAAPCVVSRQAQINSISAAEHSGAKHLCVSGRGQDLRPRRLDGQAHQFRAASRRFRRRRRSSTCLRRASFSRRSSSAAILAEAASSR